MDYCQCIMFGSEALPSKIVCTTFHPYKSWIATAHENSSVVVWDYQLNQAVYEFSLSSLDEIEKENLQLSSLQKGRPAVAQGAKSKPGNIKRLLFFDDGNTGNLIGC